MDYFYDGEWNNDILAQMKLWISEQWRVSEGVAADQDFVDYILVTLYIYIYIYIYIYNTIVLIFITLNIF